MIHKALVKYAILRRLAGTTDKECQTNQYWQLIPPVICTGTVAVYMHVYVHANVYMCLYLYPMYCSVDHCKCECDGPLAVRYRSFCALSHPSCSGYAVVSRDHNFIKLIILSPPFGELCFIGLRATDAP